MRGNSRRNGMFHKRRAGLARLAQSAAYRRKWIGRKAGNEKAGSVAGTGPWHALGSESVPYAL